MSPLASWHLVQAETHADKARRWDALCAKSVELRDVGARDIARRTVETSRSWVRAVEHLLYALTLGGPGRRGGEG